MVAAVKTTVWPAPTEVVGVLMYTTGVTTGMISGVMAPEMAVCCVVHAAPDVRVQVTASPLDRELVAKLAPAPAVFPFTFHSRTGLLPPFSGVAVKVISSPAHADVRDASIVTAGVTTGVITGVMALEVTVCCVVHAALVVRVQVTESPFWSEPETKVIPVSAAIPFTFHSKVGIIPPFSGVAVKVISSPAHA